MKRQRFAVLGYPDQRGRWDVFARGLRRKKAERVLEAYANGRGGVAFCGLHIEPDEVADDERAARRYYEAMVRFAEEHSP